MSLLGKNKQYSSWAKNILTHSIAFNMSKENIASSDIMFCLSKKKLFQCQFKNKFGRIQNNNSGVGDEDSVECRAIFHYLT